MGPGPLELGKISVLLTEIRKKEHKVSIVTFYMFLWFSDRLDIFCCFLIVLMHFACDTTSIFLDQVHLVQLGIFQLQLGKKTYFLALGMGQNICPKNRQLRALISVKKYANFHFMPSYTAPVLHNTDMLLRNTKSCVTVPAARCDDMLFVASAGMVRHRCPLFCRSIRQQYPSRIELAVL